MSKTANATPQACATLEIQPGCAGAWYDVSGESLRVSGARLSRTTGSIPVLGDDEHVITAGKITPQRLVFEGVVTEAAGEIFERVRAVWEQDTCEMPLCARWTLDDGRVYGLVDSDSELVGFEYPSPDARDGGPAPFVFEVWGYVENIPQWPVEVYVGTRAGGVYYTAGFTGPDGAMPTWTAVNTGLGSLAGFWFALDPNNRAGRQFFMAGTGPASRQLYRRTGGAWSSVLDTAIANGLVGDPAPGSLWSFCLDSANPGHIYAIYESTVVIGILNPMYLIKSTDYGDNWTDVIDLDIGLGITSVTVGNVYVYQQNIWFAINQTTNGIVRYSSDGGGSWVQTVPALAGAVWTPLIKTTDALAATSGYVCADNNIFYADLTRVDTPALTAHLLQTSLDLTPRRLGGMWIDPSDTQHQRILYQAGSQLFETNDGWVSVVDSTPPVLSPTILEMQTSTQSTSNVVGCVGGTTVFQPNTIFALDETSALVNRSGNNAGTPPYTDSIPATANGACADGLQIVR